VIAFVTAGAGFLIAVLWFDLMFDVQVFGHGQSDVPEDVLASMCGYYARVTTAARPMNRLIAAVMLATLGSSVAEAINGDASPWVAWTSLALVGAAIALAGVRTVPAAVQLGTRSNSIEHQSALARSILRQHLLCIMSMTAVLILQLAST
jgi:hypothetical protein